MNIFDLWNQRKKRLETKQKSPFFHEREIWFVNLGKNIGQEQDGKGEKYLRPVLIVRKFNQQLFWGVPLTKTLKKSNYYFPFNFLGKESTAILTQMKLFDVKRLQHKKGIVDKDTFLSIKKAIRQLLHNDS